MIIQVDREGEKVISQLCDIALKEGGIKNLNQVNKILRTVVTLFGPEVKEPCPKGDSDKVEEIIEPKVEKQEEKKEEAETEEE